MSRSFLKEKRLTISVNASNIFNKYLTFDNRTSSETFSSWSKSKSPNRYYGINISWRFGELKAQVKKAARSISNDDVKSGGDGNSSGNAGGGA